MQKSKRWLVGAIAGALVLGMGVGATAATEVRKQIEVIYKGIQIRVDGKAVTMPEGTEPFLAAAEGRTYVPARYLAEALSAKVGYDGETNTVIVQTPNYAQKGVANEQGDLYEFPVQGASIRVPHASTPFPIPGIPVNLQTPVGLISVVRFDNNPLFDVQSVMEFFVNGAKKLAPEVILKESKKVTVEGSSSAVDAIASGGGTMFRMRVMASGRNIWILSAMIKEEQSESLAPGIATVFESFKTGN